MRPALLALALACAEPAAPPDDDVELILEAVGPSPEAVDALAAALPGAAPVRAAAGDHRVGLLRLELLGDALDEGFLAVVHDYDAARSWRLIGSLDAPDAATLQPTDERPAPTLDEWTSALDVVRADPDLGPAIGAGQVEAFHAMPQLLDVPGRRVVSVGLRAGEADGEVLGVDLGTRTLVRYPSHAPPNTRVGGFVCAPPPAAPQAGLARGAQGWARVRIRHHGRDLWSMIVRRPSASSGVDGSGVELIDVRYRGAQMLRQAHVPFLNVQYDQDACGPYRDHQWQENPMQIGTTLAQVGPDIRLVDWAKTLRELHDDNGNFTGVALTWDPAHQQAVILSELEAGWYRYMSEWRFSLDGTLTPRFGFDAVENWCTCHVHNHHASWRLDVQLGAGANRIEEHDDATGWALVTEEAERLRDDAGGRSWRVSDVATGRSVRIEPLPGEDPADPFGVADVWLLAAHPNEIDDALLAPRPGVQTYVPAFVSGEPLVDQDVVVWWSGHFRHDDTNPGGNASHTVQLRIVPEVW